MDTTNHCAECERLTRERDEARETAELCASEARDGYEKIRELKAEVARSHDAILHLTREAERWSAEVTRLEGLILDWDDCWRRDPFQDPGAAGRGDEGLMAEARRIRAQREDKS